MNKKQTTDNETGKFLGIYNSLPTLEKRSLRNAVIQACNIEFPTFYAWMQRGTIPKWHIGKACEIAEDYSPKTEIAL